MSFDEVSVAAPWIERGHTLGADVFAPQRFEPRLFKTHLRFRQANSGARYIHVVRDPRDIVVSLYDFLSTTVIDHDAISVDTFVGQWLLAELGDRDDGTPPGPYRCDPWSHLLSWWHARAHVPVLTVAFEHLRRDLTSQVARIAEFLEVERDPELLALVTRQSTFAFMREHSSQFSEIELDTKRRRAKVVTGREGDHRARLSATLTKQLDDAWRRRITTVLGFETHEQLIAAI
jgi:hypothetical protein